MLHHELTTRGQRRRTDQEKPGAPVRRCRNRQDLEHPAVGKPEGGARGRRVRLQEELPAQAHQLLVRDYPGAAARSSAGRARAEGLHARAQEERRLADVLHR